jgi:hypothetical protein
MMGTTQERMESFGKALWHSKIKRSSLITHLYQRYSLEKY